MILTTLLHQLYRKAGRAADVVMVNSSWTKGHIEELWEGEQPSHLIYPPCDVEPLKQIQHKGKQKQVFLYQAKIPPSRHMRCYSAGYGNHTKPLSPTLLWCSLPSITKSGFDEMILCIDTEEILKFG